MKDHWKYLLSDEELRKLAIYVVEWSNKQDLDIMIEKTKPVLNNLIRFIKGECISEYDIVEILVYKFIWSDRVKSNMGIESLKNKLDKNIDEEFEKLKEKVNNAFEYLPRTDYSQIEVEDLLKESKNKIEEIKNLEQNFDLNLKYLKKYWEVIYPFTILDEYYEKKILNEFLKLGLDKKELKIYIQKIFK